MMGNYIFEQLWVKHHGIRKNRSIRLYIFLNNIKAKFQLLTNTIRSKEKKGFMSCVVLQVSLGIQIMRSMF